MGISLKDYLLMMARQRPAVVKASEGVEREAELQDAIAHECRRRGWLAIRSRMDRATTNTVGTPDFIILRPGGGLLLIEAKSRTGKLRPEQLSLHAMAQSLGHEVHTVRTLEEFNHVASAH